MGFEGEAFDETYRDPREDDEAGGLGHSGVVPGGSIGGGGGGLWRHLACFDGDARTLFEPRQRDYCFVLKRVSW